MDTVKGQGSTQPASSRSGYSPSQPQTRGTGAPRQVLLKIALFLREPPYDKDMSYGRSNLYGLKDCLFSSGLSLKIMLIDQLQLEVFEKTLRHSVIPAATFPTHTLHNQRVFFSSLVKL
ncbi:hypothetical protein GCM10028807_55440 [Spirosoma daeguense]